MVKKCFNNFFLDSYEEYYTLKKIPILNNVK